MQFLYGELTHLNAQNRESAAESLADELAYGQITDEQAASIAEKLFQQFASESDSTVQESILNALNEGINRFGTETIALDWDSLLRDNRKFEPMVLHQLIPALEGVDTEIVNSYLEGLTGHSDDEVRDLLQSRLSNQ